MRQRLHIDNLRKSDPSAIQVLAGDALRQPHDRLDPRTVADLVALSEVEDLPKTLKRDLESFAHRVGQEIADLPNGEGFAEFVTGFEQLDPTRVPETLRAYVRRETEREGRNQAGREKAAQLFERWAGTEPETLDLPTAPVHPVRKASAEQRTPAARARRSRAAESSGVRRISPGPDTDPEREQWVEQLCIERLAGYTEQGLAEPVLVAGICHRARERYPDLSPAEVTSALRTLKDQGQVRYSAGRWRVAQAW